MDRNGTLFGRCHGRRQDVELTLEPDITMTSPGLAGVTIHTALGTEIALNRGPGGLSARRRTKDGNESTWTVLGASRGEARHPRRGHPPGAAARPDLRAGPRTGGARHASVNEFLADGSRAGERVPADRPVRVPVRLRDLRPGGAERQRGVALPAPLRLAERVRRRSSTATPAGSASVPPTWTCRPTAATCPGTMVLETSWGTRGGWIIVRDVLLIGPVAPRRRPLPHPPPLAHRLRRRSRAAAAGALRERRGAGAPGLRAGVRLRPRTATWEYDGRGYHQAVATAEGSDVRLSSPPTCGWASRARAPPRAP